MTTTTNNNTTESEAIAKAKQLLKNVNGENWTISYMTAKEAEKYIWTYLFDNGFQYLAPIKYSNNMVALCHQN